MLLLLQFYVKYLANLKTLFVTNQVVRFIVHGWSPCAPYLYGKLFEPIHACLCDGRQVPVAIPHIFKMLNYHLPAMLSLARIAGRSLTLNREPLNCEPE